MSNPISFSSVAVDADGITGFNQRGRKLFVSMEEIQSMEIERGKVSEWPKLQLVAGILSIFLCLGLIFSGIRLLPYSLMVLGIWLIRLSRHRELVLLVRTEDDTKRLSLGKEIAMASLHRFIESVRETYGLEIIRPASID